MNKQQMLHSLLSDLKTQVPQLFNAVVVTRDGVSLAQLVKASDTPEQIASMAATTLALGRRFSNSLLAGQMTETTVSSETEQIHVYAAGEEGVLVLVAPHNVLELPVHARNTAKAVATVLA